MKNLNLKESKKVFTSPSIVLNAQTGKCEIIGESLISDAFEFYQPVYEWVTTYVAEVKGKLAWDFRLAYFNSSSAKAINNLFKILKKYELDGGQIAINWHYPHNNISLYEEGECLQDVNGLSFNFVSY